MSGVRIIGVGSVNLDLVAACDRLPAPGETVTGARFAKYPGGKGANQALAARRLGAVVSMIARVGKDAHAEAALALLREDGVDLSHLVVDEEAATGVALIAVDAEGENQIVVASGANGKLEPRDVEGVGPADAVLCQLEVPVAAVEAASRIDTKLFAINLAPALPVPAGLLERADLLIVNEGEPNSMVMRCIAVRAWWPRRSAGREPFSTVLARRSRGCRSMRFRSSIRSGLAIRSAARLPWRWRRAWKKVLRCALLPVRQPLR